MTRWAKFEQLPAAPPVISQLINYIIRPTLLGQYPPLTWRARAGDRGGSKERAYNRPSYKTLMLQLDFGKLAVGTARSIKIHGNSRLSGLYIIQLYNTCYTAKTQLYDLHN